MLSKISNCIFSLMLVLTSVAHSQEKEKKDSVVGTFIPTGIRLGTDAISIVKNFTKSDFKGWEVNADVDFRNYYLALKVGNWSRNVGLENGNYTNSGNYWRTGVDINLLKKDPVKNMFFLGFRYGHSKYDEQLKYTITTPEFGSIEKSLKNDNLTSHWLELTTGLKVKVLKFFWMGYTARIKFSPSLHKDVALQSYDIPGYGLTFKKPWWGFDYYLMFRFPFHKKK